MLRYRGFFESVLSARQYLANLSPKNQSSLPKNIYDDICSASGGWLDNFNKTFEIRLVTKLSSNKSALVPFQNESCVQKVHIPPPCCTKVDLFYDTFLQSINSLS